VSSDGSGGAEDPAGALARGGARSLQLGSRQTERLERRLQKHHGTVSSPARASSAAEPTGTPRSGARKVAVVQSASDDELTLDGSMRTPAATIRVGPHAALSGLTQRVASSVLGTVRHLAGGAGTADSPDAFVGVEADDHDCTARGMRTRCLLLLYDCGLGRNIQCDRIGCCVPAPVLFSISTTCCAWPAFFDQFT
jgi:hypothetical protein